MTPDTGGKFAAGVVDTGGNLPPVSLKPAGKHKGNCWQNLPPVSLIPVENLPPVVDTGGNLPPVVHLDLRISPRIFAKNLK
jgi:hypothetical protein